MFITFLFITTIFVCFTLMPLLKNEAWWIRTLEFPRLQFFLLLSILLILQLILLDLSFIHTRGLILVTLTCLIYQALWIIPYTPFFSVEVNSANSDNNSERLRIITANVLTPNRNAEGLIALVNNHDPDILVTLESDKWWQLQLDILEETYPYTIKCPLDNLYGMHVYSKLPLVNGQIEFLVESDKPSIHTLIKLPSGTEIRAHFLHPAPPSPTENAESSERDAELIIVARSIADAENNIPIIVTGDSNDVAWSETTRLFRKMSGLLDPRVGRGMFNTFHADYWFLRWPLDHLFHSNHFTLKNIKRLKSFGSDHFALFTELVLDAGQNNQHNGLNVDSEDKAWAKAKASNQNVSKNDVPQPEKD